MTTRRRDGGARAAEMVWLIGEAFRWTRQLSDEMLRPHGVSSADLRILFRLRAEPGLSGAEVARRTFVTPQAAYVALASLEKKGLVERALGPDHQRIVRCEVTEKGHRLTEACLHELRQVAADFGDVLDPAEQKQVIDLMRRCLSAKGADMGPPGGWDRVVKGDLGH